MVSHRSGWSAAMYIESAAGVDTSDLSCQTCLDQAYTHVHKALSSQRRAIGTSGPCIGTFVPFVPSEIVSLIPHNNHFQLDNCACRAIFLNYSLILALPLPFARLVTSTSPKPKSLTCTAGPSARFLTSPRSITPSPFAPFPTARNVPTSGLGGWYSLDSVLCQRN